MEGGEERTRGRGKGGERGEWGRDVKGESGVNSALVVGG